MYQYHTYDTSVRYHTYPISIIAKTAAFSQVQQDVLVTTVFLNSLGSGVKGEKRILTLARHRRLLVSYHTVHSCWPARNKIFINIFLGAAAIAIFLCTHSARMYVCTYCTYCMYYVDRPGCLVTIIYNSSKRRRAVFTYHM